jgi:hypothetical protein
MRCQKHAPDIKASPLRDILRKQTLKTPLIAFFASCMVLRFVLSLPSQPLSTESWAVLLLSHGPPTARRMAAGVAGQSMRLAGRDKIIE